MARSTLETEAAGRRFAYLFEAKGIQRYIFDSGSMRDLIGASDLVAELAHSRDRRERDEVEAASALVGDIERDLIGRVIEALGIKEADGKREADEVEFSRRASGVLMLHADTAAPLEKVRALMRLTAQLRCPGLEMSDTRPIELASDIDAARQAYTEGSALRINTGAGLPPTGHPLTEFNARTGRVATRLFRYREDTVMTDGISEAHRLRADRLQGRTDEGVAMRYLGANRTDPAGLKYVFPRNLDPTEPDEQENPLFPFEGDDRRIAVVHADLSGLGQVWRSLDNASPAARIEAAREIESHIENAAQRAVQDILLEKAKPCGVDEKLDGISVVPARPVVLGGDDLTILVRADLALDFVSLLLAKIEEPVTLRGESKWLSACAGVAIVRAGQPFLMAYHLAESLCSFAKKAAKHNRPAGGPFSSMLAFHNALSTLEEAYAGDEGGEGILGREKTVASGLRLTGNPYVVGTPPADAEPGRPRFSALLDLAIALAQDSRGLGKLIELAHHIGGPASGGNEAEKESWRRWREVLRARDESRDDADKVLKRFDQALKQGFGVSADDSSLPLAKAREGDKALEYFPIADALELIDLKTVALAEA